MESARTAAPANYFINKVDYSSLCKRKRMVNWSHHETVTLISLWKEHLYDLRSLKRNGHVYLGIEKRLMEHGIDRSVSEIRTKIMNLTAEYRREKAKASREGCASNWKYYYHVNEVIGHIPVPDNFRPSESIVLSHFSTPSNDSDKTCSPPVTVKRSLSCDDLQIISPSQDTFTNCGESDNSVEAETSKSLHSSSPMQILPMKPSTSNSISVIPLSETSLYQQSKSMVNGTKPLTLYTENQFRHSNTIMKQSSPHITSPSTFSTCQRQQSVVSNVNHVELSIKKPTPTSTTKSFSTNDNIQAVITISEIPNSRQQSQCDKSTSFSSQNNESVPHQQACNQTESYSHINENSVHQSSAETAHPASPKRQKKLSKEKFYSKYLREMLNEQKRCNEAAELAESQALQLMKEQISLQRQSLSLQSRMIDILESFAAQTNASLSGEQSKFSPSSNPV